MKTKTSEYLTKLNVSKTNWIQYLKVISRNTTAAYQKIWLIQRQDEIILINFEDVFE